MPPLSASPRRSTAPLRPDKSASRSAMDTQIPALTLASMRARVAWAGPAASPGGLLGDGLPATSRPDNGRREPRRGAMDQRKMTEAQRAYEAKRAAKAGLTLERWLERKEKTAAEERGAAKQRSAAAVEAKAKPGRFARWLEKAQKPL